MPKNKNPVSKKLIIMFALGLASEEEMNIIENHLGENPGMAGYVATVKELMCSIASSYEIYPPERS